MLGDDGLEEGDEIGLDEAEGGVKGDAVVDDGGSLQGSGGGRW